MTPQATLTPFPTQTPQATQTPRPTLTLPPTRTPEPTESEDSQITSFFRRFDYYDQRNANLDRNLPEALFATDEPDPTPTVDSSPLVLGGYMGHKKTS